MPPAAIVSLFCQQSYVHHSIYRLYIPSCWCNWRGGSLRMHSVPPPCPPARPFDDGVDQPHLIGLMFAKWAINACIFINCKLSLKQPIFLDAHIYHNKFLAMI